MTERTPELKAEWDRFYDLADGDRDEMMFLALAQLAEREREFLQIVDASPTPPSCKAWIRVRLAATRSDNEAQQAVCGHGYRGYCQQTKQAAHLCSDSEASEW